VTSLPLAVGLYGFLLLSFAPISLVFDETGVVTALGRSIRFMRQRIGQLLVLTLIYLALYLATGLVTEWIPALLNTVVTATAFRVVVTVVFTLVSFCVNGYLNVLVAATLTSLYAGAQDGGTVVTADIPATS